MRDIKCYPTSTGVRDIRRINYISRKPIYDFLKGVGKNEKGLVLDFGCGNMPYRNLFPHVSRYVGLDVETAKEYGFSGGDVIYYDGNVIPSEDETFDMVFSIQVFEHVENLDDTLREINRVLKYGGKLAFTCPMAGSTHYVPFDFRRFTEYGLLKQLEKHGFSDIHILGSTNYKNTVRYLKIQCVPRMIRKIYALWVNICFVMGEGIIGEMMVKFENIVRKMLNKNPKQDETKLFPISFMVECYKK